MVVSSRKFNGFVAGFLLCLSSCKPVDGDQSAPTGDETSATEPVAESDQIAGVNLVGCQPYNPNPAAEDQTHADLACALTKDNGSVAHITDPSQLSVSAITSGGESTTLANLEAADPRTGWSFVVKVAKESMSGFGSVKVALGASSAARKVEGTINVVLVSALIKGEADIVDFGDAAIREELVEKRKILFAPGGIAAKVVGDAACEKPFDYSGGSYPGVSAVNPCGREISADCGVALSFKPTSLGVASKEAVISYNSGPRILDVKFALKGRGALLATRVIGQDDFQSVAPNRGGTAAAATLKYPTAVTGNDDVILIADSKNNRIVSWPGKSDDSTPLVAITQVSFATSGASAFNQPKSISIHGGDLFFSDFNNRLYYSSLLATKPMVADQNSREIFAGLSTLGDWNFVNVSDSGILVTEQSSSRVTWWESPTVPQTGAIAGGVVLNLCGLSQPSSSELLGEKILLADSGNHRVLLWNSKPVGASCTLAAVAVGDSDVSAPSQSVRSAASTTLNHPTQATSDGHRLFVADRDNNRILIWGKIPAASGVAANCVFGQGSFSSSDIGKGRNGLYRPESIFLRGVGSDQPDMIVADTQNNRVLVVPLPAEDGWCL